MSAFTWEGHRLATETKWTAEKALKRDPENVGAMVAIMIAVAYLLPSTSANKGAITAEEEAKWDEMHVRFNTLTHRFRQKRKEAR